MKFNKEDQMKEDWKNTLAHGVMLFLAFYGLSLLLKAC